MMPTARFLCGDAREQLATLPDASVDCCITSPPYADLIDYGSGPSIGPEGYADWAVAVCQAIARVLKPGGVLAWNLNGRGEALFPEEVAVRLPRETSLRLHDRVAWVKANAVPARSRSCHTIPEWEPIWVWRRGDRLAYFGREDIRRPYSETTLRRSARGNLHRGRQGNHRDQAHPYVRADFPEYVNPAGRDAANVIWAAPEQSPQWAHPARFPKAIPDFFIRAYCPVGGTVLDPFVGSGTTAAVALRLGRHAIGIDLNPAYVAMAERRARQIGLALEVAP